jgi:hypothetical protein
MTMRRTDTPLICILPDVLIGSKKLLLYIVTMTVTKPKDINDKIKSILNSESAYYIQYRISDLPMSYLKCSFVWVSERSAGQNV